MRKSLRKRRRGDNFVANSTIFLDGRMKKIMNGTINTDEKELLRYTQLDQPIKDLLAGKFEDVFEKVLDNTNSVHKQMANEPLKTALSNIRKMLYKMEIMFIDKKLPGNLEDVEEKLIQAFVTLSQKVSPATDPASAPAAALSDSAASAPAAAAKPIVAPAAAALSDTKPIVDPADDGPTGEAARHKSDEVRNAEKVIKAKAAEDAAEKAEKAARNAVLASPGAVETKDGK